MYLLLLEQLHSIWCHYTRTVRLYTRNNYLIFPVISFLWFTLKFAMIPRKNIATVTTNSGQWAECLHTGTKGPLLLLTSNATELKHKPKQFLQTPPVALPSSELVVIGDLWSLCEGILPSDQSLCITNSECYLRSPEEFEQ